MHGSIQGFLVKQQAHPTEILTVSGIPSFIQELPDPKQITNTTYPPIDVTALPYQDSSFDMVASEMVLEHVHDPFKAVLEMRRVLRPGGLLVLATTGIYPEHKIPNDYWRFMRDGIEHLVHGMEILLLKAWGGLEAIKHIFGHASPAECDVRDSKIMERIALTESWDLPIVIWVIARKQN